MGAYRYTALNDAGIRESGQLEAASEAQAIDALLAKRLTPVRIAVDAGSSQPAAIALRDRATVLRGLAPLFQARISATEALQLAITMARRRLQPRLQDAADKLRGGAALSAALFDVGIVNDSERSALTAGEKAGRLPEALTRLADGLVRAEALKSELMSAALYPVILIVALIATLAIMFVGVLPVLMPLFLPHANELPFATRALIALYDLSSSWGGAILVAVSLIALVSALWLRTDAGRRIFDRWSLRGRLGLGLPKDLAGAALARSLGTLLGGGLALLPALEAAAPALRNREARAVLQDATAKVREGGRLGQTLRASRAFPDLLVEFVRIGEETGRLPELAHEAALILEARVKDRLKRMTVLVTPLATLILGGLIAFLMAGIVGGIMAATAPAAGL